MKAVVYLMQVSACTGIFYLFYYLFLRRLTFFKLNRWYLLATLLFSFVIPAITIPVSPAQASAIMRPAIYAQQAQLVTEPLPVVVNNRSVPVPQVNWMLVARYVYLVMALISIIHLLISLALFFWRMRNEELLQIGNIKILKADKVVGNSSFLNIIFINDEGLEPYEVKQIIAHEMLHVSLMHSADRLIARLIQVILWFNPFAYLYIRAIEENHEFEVDRIAANEDDKGIYAQLLFKLASSGQDYLFHGFSKVPIKKRIAMLFNQPTKNMKKIIYVFMLPLVVISCLAFANLEKDETKLSTVKTNTKIAAQLTVIDKINKENIIYLKTDKVAVKDMSAGWYEVTANEWKKMMRTIPDFFKEDSDDAKPITWDDLQHFIKRLNAVHQVDYRLPTETEWEYTAKYYTRLHLKDDNGHPYDKIVIRTKAGSWAATNVIHRAKAAFFIDQTYYTEEAIKNLSPITIATLGGSVGVKDILQKDHPGVDLHGYQAIFLFTTHGVPDLKYPWETQIPDLSKSFGAIKPAGKMEDIAKEDTIKATAIKFGANGQPIRFAQKDASHSLIDEYSDILKRGNLPSKKGDAINLTPNISATDREKLKALYLQMSRKQQLQQYVRVVPHFGLVYKNIAPTQQQLNTWQKSAFVIMVNDKKIKNEELANYKPSDLDFRGTGIISYKDKSIGKKGVVFICTNSYLDAQMKHQQASTGWSMREYGKGHEILIMDNW